MAGFAVAGDPITIGETLTFKSKVMDEERIILVSTPPGYRQTQEPYIVLYLTDGRAHFTHTRGTVDVLSRNGLMPQMIIVAVENTDRNRDLTPTQAEYRGNDGSVREFPTSGGSAKFLDFFEQELIPFIDSHYRTLPYRVFAGHSFGGLFALSAVFDRPQLFDAVLAVSPSLLWDDEYPARTAKIRFEESEDFEGNLFLAMANEEAGDPRPNRLDRLEGVIETADSDSFRYQVMRMPDESHGSVVLRAHYWGLRYVFEPWRLPVDPDLGRFAGNLDDFKNHYAKLTEYFGFTVQPSELTVNFLGYQMLGRDEINQAIEVFRYNVTLYPKSANVYDSLGEALENAGRVEESFANYSKAVANARKAEDTRLEIFTRNRDRAKALLDQRSPVDQTRDVVDGRQTPSSRPG
jgi:predicted alpha/beta superfamily hydrolase